MRVLLDTNILISALLSPDHQGTIQTLLAQLFQGAFTLLLPEDVVEEFATTVIRKKHLARAFTVQSLEAAMAALIAVAEIVPKIRDEIPRVGRDVKDDYLLAYATIGMADYLVTGDQDLLVLRQVGDVAIVTPAQLLVLVQSAH
ncbi:MAG: putative toxin-antitoxin system toxin component, PIN family [Kouleothrix sp.]|jgi:putative PIN family toxin of toxin-antitoxin system|nr:putative toxin-antitoxin system toxin component, PIN family [Kouleothrix sp.]